MTKLLTHGKYLFFAFCAMNYLKKYKVVRWRHCLSQENLNQTQQIPFVFQTENLTKMYFDVFLLGTLRFFENFPVLETLRFFENFHSLCADSVLGDFEIFNTFSICGLCAGGLCE